MTRSKVAASVHWLPEPVRRKRIIKIGPGEHHVSDAEDEAISTVLGSCVAACICDPVARVGGLNHFMLPESLDGVWGLASASLRYGNFAMERLINDILVRGGHRSRLEVKLFGGGRLGLDHAGIGERNAAYVEAYLRTKSMVPQVVQLRGRYARKVIYLPVDGTAFLQELPAATAHVALVETRFGRHLPHRMSTGEAELFD